MSEAFITTNANEKAKWNGTLFTLHGAVSGAWTTVKNSLAIAYNSATGLSSSVSDGQIGWFRAQYIDQSYLTHYAIFRGTYADSGNTVTPVSNSIVLSSSGTSMPTWEQVGSEDANLRIFSVSPAEALRARNDIVAYRSSDQSISASTTTTIVFDTEVYDDQNLMSSGIFTADRDRRVKASGAIRINGGSTGDTILVLMDNSSGLDGAFYYTRSSGANQTLIIPEMTYAMVSGETLKMTINSPNAITVKGTSGYHTFMNLSMSAE